MALTWARIAMIPLVVGIFYLPDSWLAPHWKNIIGCWLFILAAITDAPRITDRLSESDKGTLMGGTLQRVYRWSPKTA